MRGALANPGGLAIDANGILYVADTGNHRVLKIEHPEADQPVVTTIAGDGNSGLLVAIALQAEMMAPEALAFDTDGSLLILDTLAEQVRRLSPAGNLELFAGGNDNPVQDGYWSDAGFHKRDGLALFKGDVVVADSGNDRLRLIRQDASLATGTVTTLTGLGGDAKVKAYQDGPGAQAEFYDPCGIVADTHGKLYIADEENSYIRVLY